MAALLEKSSYAVTADKISDLVAGIVRASNPVAVIAFGSRARGTHRPDSDLDVAVIFDNETDAHNPEFWQASEKVNMSLDLLPITQERFDNFKPWINTVHREIDREGVRLYERGRQSADRNTLRRLC